MNEIKIPDENTVQVWDDGSIDANMDMMLNIEQWYKLIPINE